jgi:MazG family protein
MTKRRSVINDLLRVMARLRAPDGCPWDREQDHKTLRWHAVEEVYELMDAIEADDDEAMEEELGDVLMQVVFHCQLAKERGAFDFNRVARRLTDKLIGRHPHVFGELKVKDVAQVWANWDKIKHAEKHGTRHARPSALDGIPEHLPALLRAEKLVKKARKAGLLDSPAGLRRRAAKTKSQASALTHRYRDKLSRKALAGALFDLANLAQRHGWSAEDLLGREIKRRERQLRRREAVQGKRMAR